MNRNLFCQSPDERTFARRCYAFSLVECMLAVTVMSLVLLTALSISSSALTAADKNATETGLTGGSRLAVDETLSQIRGSKEVLGAQVLGGLSYTTGASQVVLAAPGYNPASAAFYLDNVTDYVSVRYDSTNKRLLQTLVPGSGSVRPLRTNYVLASNVAACTFTYRVRDYFTSGIKSNATFIMNGPPLAKPLLYVNGVATSYTYNTSNRTATVSLSNKSNDLQFLYTIDPATAGTSIALVGEIEVALQLASKDSRQTNRTMTLQGSARLRNLRK